jgi:Kef-type K+ transport system membrane component KefB
MYRQLIFIFYIAGILLGPSALGYIPGFKENVFPDSSLPAIQVMALTGLIFFMFLVGMELDPQFLKKNATTYATVATIGVILPIGLSLPFTYLIYKPEWALDSSFLNYALFLGVALGSIYRIYR